jgi:hypothetical protein
MAMSQPLTRKLVAGLVGAAVIGGLVAAGGVVLPAILQTTLASEPALADALQPLQHPSRGAALDNNLLRVDGKYYGVASTPDVSLTPLSSTVVRKIGYGQTTFVTIATTSSGTYSTDGLTSPNIRYPGIFTEREHIVFLPFAGIFGWSHHGGWVRIPLTSAHSVGFLDSDLVPHSQRGVCVTDTIEGGCR